MAPSFCAHMSSTRHFKTVHLPKRSSYSLNPLPTPSDVLPLSALQSHRLREPCGDETSTCETTALGTQRDHSSLLNRAPAIYSVHRIYMRRLLSACVLVYHRFFIFSTLSSACKLTLVIECMVAALTLTGRTNGNDWTTRPLRSYAWLF